MGAKLQWAWEHRKLIAAALAPVWIAIATVVARYVPRPPPETVWWKRALFDLVIDNPAAQAPPGRVGAWGRRGNLPFVPSRQPSDNPTPAASKLMRLAKIGDRTGEFRARLVLPLLVALGLASGCAAGRALGRCEIGTLPQQLEGLLVRMAAAAFGAGGDWQAQLELAARDAAPGQAACIAQALDGFIEDMTTARRGQTDERWTEAQRRVRSFLATHPPTACGELPRKVMLAHFGGGGASGSF